MKQFKDSVPLMVSLKHEAMRDKHWEKLMEKTGKFFNMQVGNAMQVYFCMGYMLFCVQADTFTLDNMFSMELHKYQSIAEEIVNYAVKEFAIERDLEEISKVCESLRFTVTKHFRGSDQRGYYHQQNIINSRSCNHFCFNRFILGAVDEVTAAMEDNIMTLQSMVASQFIGPFLQAVQKLERALSLGVEIIDEWMVTQRKWCYLEGIFIGGDIRSQLPDEARKFDDIDKSFQRVKLIPISNFIVKINSLSLQIMYACEANSVVLSVCVPERLTEFQMLSSGLENCQKSLNDYLDSKRRVFSRYTIESHFFRPLGIFNCTITHLQPMSFPLCFRFYFISTDELLSIMGSSKADCVQEHMIKVCSLCFYFTVSLPVIFPTSDVRQHKKP